MHDTSVEVNGRKYWVSALTGEVVSKELVLKRQHSISEPIESVFIVEKSGREHSVEMNVLASAFRQGSNISLLYLSNRENRSGKLALVYNHDIRKLSGCYDQLRIIGHRYSRPMMLLSASLLCAAFIYFFASENSIIAALLALVTIPISAAIFFVLYMNSSYFTSWRDRRRARAFIENEDLLNWVTKRTE